MANMFPFHTVPPTLLPEPVYSPEYMTMLSCTPELNGFIALNPKLTYDEMIAAGLVQSVHTHVQEFICNPTHTNRAKATKLVDFMTDQVKTSPSDFDKFMKIIKKLSWTKHIVDTLQSSYQEKKKLIEGEKQVN